MPGWASRFAARQNMTIRSQIWGFAFLCALSILFWWHALAMTMELALSNEAYTHILLILPLSVSLIYLDRSRWRRNDRDAGLALSRGRIVGGLAALAGAALIFCFARWGQSQFNISPGGQLSLSMFALVIWWVGSVILSFGVGVFRTF